MHSMRIPLLFRILIFPITYESMNVPVLLFPRFWISSSGISSVIYHIMGWT